MLFNLKDALKFFHAFIKEMVDVGGINLPKAIATKTGSRLGRLYKERGWVGDIESALKHSYKAIRGKPKIIKNGENIYEIFLKYSKRFCPIGGSYHPSNASLFQENVCIPYTRAFLSEMFSQFKFDVEILSCILKTNHKSCSYVLKVEKKNNFD